jgi:acetylornithine deacetylase
LLSETEFRVLALIEDQQSELIATLQQMIRYKTVTPALDARANVKEFRGHQKFVHSLLDEMGFESEMWEVDASQLEDGPGRGVIPYRDMSGMPVVAGRLPSEGDGKSLILNGHYDVVPEGDVSLWKFDPFSASIEQGRLYGRGGADMKGGNAAMIFAVKMIQKAGLTLNGDLTVQVAPDEEATCMGTLSCCQRGYTADAAFIPEPTNMGILVAMRGSVWGTITVHGRAGHAEMAQPHWTEGGAVNAISKAAKVVQLLDDMALEWRTRPDRQHKYVGADFVIPTIIHGGEWDVTYPEKVQVRFGAMVAPGRGSPVNEIRSRLTALAQTDPWLAAHPPELVTGPFWYPAEVSEDEPIVRAGEAALSDIGITPRLKGFGSLTDAIHLINLSKIPTISIGPDMETIHSVDEHVEISQLVALAKTIALIVMRWCRVSEHS